MMTAYKFLPSTLNIIHQKLLLIVALFPPGKTQFDLQYIQPKMKIRLHSS